MDKSKSIYYECCYKTVLVLLLVVFNFYWFWELSDDVFLIGDDVRLYNYITTSDNLFRLVFTAETGVFRPVSYGILVILIKIFGTNHIAYFVLNLLLNCLITFCVFKVIERVTEKKNYIFPFLGSLLYIMSIYSYYGVTQILGIMEQMCVLFLICFFYMLWRYTLDSKKVHMALSIVFYVLAIFSHERFIVLCGVYFVVSCLGIKEVSFKRRCFILFSGIIPLFLFVFIKICILGSPLFVGTGQMDIEFSWMTAFANIWQSIASMFGFNEGASWLFGRTFSEYTYSEKFMSFIVLLIFVSTFLIYFIKEIILEKNRMTELKLFVVFVFTEGATIVCYAVSSRIEMRQIAVPYALLLIYIMYCFSRIMNNYREVLLFLTVFVIGINDYQFKQNIDSLFFMRAMSIGKTGYEATMVLGDDIKNYQFYIEENNELQWAMLLTDEKDMFYMHLGYPVEYDTFVVDENIDDKVKYDLDCGKKVRVIYVNNSCQTSYLEYEPGDNCVDVCNQIVR